MAEQRDRPWSDGLRRTCGQTCRRSRDTAPFALTVGILGNWGSGKSSLLQITHRELESEKDEQGRQRFAERALLGGQYMVEGYSGDLKI